MIITILVAVAVLVWLSGFVVYVDAFVGVLVMNVITSKLHSIGPGLNIVWPWEKLQVDTRTSLKARSYSFSCDFEIKDKDKKEDNELTVFTLTIGYDVLPRLKKLRDYRSFETDERIRGMQGNIMSIMQNVILDECKERKDIMDKGKLDAITKRTKEEFEKAIVKEDESDSAEKGTLLEDYYGVELTSLVIANPELPKVLKEATVKREAMREESVTRSLEMEKIKEMAKELVKASNSTMTFENALHVVQIQFGSNVKKNIQIYGVDKGTQVALQEILKAVLKKEIVLKTS